MIRKTLLSAAATLTLALGAGAQNIAITNAKVWTGTDAGTLENANIYILSTESVTISTFC